MADSGRFVKELTGAHTTLIKFTLNLLIAQNMNTEEFFDQYGAKLEIGQTVEVVNSGGYLKTETYTGVILNMSWLNVLITDDEAKDGVRGISMPFEKKDGKFLAYKDRSDNYEKRTPYTITILNNAKPNYAGTFIKSAGVGQSGIFEVTDKHATALASYHKRKIRTERLTMIGGSSEKPTMTTGTKITITQ